MTIEDRNIDVDVIIIGAGPAGLMSALTFAKYGTSFRIFDKRPQAVSAGQADGLQPRTLEVLQSLNIARPFLDYGRELHEVNFWNPDPDSPQDVVRTSTVPDTITPARFPETTFHQGHLEQFFMEAIAKYDRTVERSIAFVGLHPVNEGNAICVQLESLETGERFELVAKYVVGCDGAHSKVRKAIGVEMVGDQTDHIWGVMDIRTRTNFPDIRMRCAIHSNTGSLLLIPREEELIRCYVQVDKTINPCSSKTRFERNSVSVDGLISQAKKAFAPYQFEVEKVEWFAAYQIGQRVADTFCKFDRVFIAGDACHTHSPKAGQGMNISMMDSYNLTWRISLVLKGLAKPILLGNYEFERIAVARYLIDFDRRFSAMFSATAHETTHSKFETEFLLGNKFTSGAGLCYSKSIMTDPYVDFRVNPDAIGPITPGMRLLNIHLTRQIDACPRALHDDMPSNGRFKVIIYSGAEKDQGLADFGNLLASPSSFLNRFTEPSARNASPTYETVTFGPANSDFTFDCFLIHSMNRHQNPIADFPEPFNTWRWRIFHDVRTEVADYWGLDQPAAIIVRPDGYVGVIRSIGDSFIAAASQYFDSFMIDVK